MNLQEIHTQKGTEIELIIDVPSNMTASKFHRIIKKLGGKIEGRVFLFENQKPYDLEQSLINNGLI